MAHSDDIQHFCHMISAHADILRGTMVDEWSGYLTRLEVVAGAGGFITNETEEAIALKNTEEELRGLADRIALVRDGLILNGGEHPNG